MKILNLKTITPYITALVFILAATLIMKDCKGKQLTGTVQNTNQLDEIIQDKDAVIIAAKERIQILKDSLAIVNKPKIVYRYKTVYDSLLIFDTTCIKSLIILNDACLKKDSVNDYIIQNQSNQIADFITITNNQQDIIDIKNYQQNVDSVSIEQLKLDVKTEIKNGNRKYRKGLMQGGVIGGAVGFIGGLLVL